MQRLILRPGPLTSRVVSASGSEGPPLEYDDLNTSLMAGSALARLTPLEYALVMALLCQRRLWQSAPGLALCCGVRQLCAISKSSSEKSVHRHLNSAARKIEALGIRVVRLHAEDRYMVLFASEIESQERQEDPLIVVS